ncbi:MAG: hypothetical protein V3T72_02310, partial [Thermoanaerobaculia bacterium]
MDRATPPSIVFLAIATAAALSMAPPATALEIVVSFGESLSSEPLDGRVLVLLSTDGDSEPRFQVGAGVDAIQIFGVDVDGLSPGGEAAITLDTFGYPLRGLAEVPPGEYHVQALLHRYETFHRADGHTVKLPMDRGEGQHWNRAPGNLYSQPQKIRIDARERKRLLIELDQEIPPIEKPEDTEWVKHIEIESKLLTEFWGRPMHLGAHVLLPAGFDEHPEARYPLVVFHGHFPADFGGFRTTPPDPDLECEYSERFQV